VTLRLRPEARWIAVDGGTVVVSDVGQAHLPAGVDRWLDRLAPHLDGSRGVADLTATLSADRSRVLLGVLDALRAHGIVVEDHDPVDPRGGEAAMLHSRYGRALPRTTVCISGDSPLREPLRTALIAAGVPVAQGDRSADGLALTAGTLRVPVLLGARELWFGGDLASAVRRAGPPPVGAAPSVAVRAVLAGQVVRHLLRLLVGAGDNRMRVVTWPALRSSAHAVVPFPTPVSGLPGAESPTTRAAAEASVTDRLSVLAAAPPIGEQDFSTAVTSLCDDRFGVFGALDEGDLRQLPLHVSTASVADPYQRAGRRPTVCGYGLDLTTARRRTALRALARYAALARDPSCGDRVAGGCLADGTVHWLPAATAYPLDDSPGLAAGLDWSAALAAALLGLCRTLLPGAAGPHAPLRLAPDGAAAPLGRLAAVLRAPITCRDLTGWLGVPAVACLRGGRTVSAACGRTLDEAAQDALGQALADRTRPGPLPSLPSAGCAPPPPRTLDVAALVAALVARGRRPVAVALDGDPAVTAVLPFLVNVVLVR
jgi:hypothetical protein